MKFIYPDTDWYCEISEQKSALSHCPHANVHRCPRYYSSLYLLGAERITTEIESEKVKELDEFWRRSDLLPVVAEHDTGIFGDKKQFSNFCPEISFDVFGLFAVDLSRYTDEIDKGVVYAELKKNAYPKDWRFQWAGVTPLHSLECTIYSQIESKGVNVPPNSSRVETNQEMIEIKPEFMGISLNIRVLITRIANWWLSKQK
ncbi:MAG: hypothetical protein ABFD82_12695 [Syntrophaceae bacterium]